MASWNLLLWGYLTTVGALNSCTTLYISGNTAADVLRVMVGLQMSGCWLLREGKACCFEGRLWWLEAQCSYPFLLSPETTAAQQVLLLFPGLGLSLGFTLS